MTRVIRLVPFQQDYGGNHYEDAVQSALAEAGVTVEVRRLTTPASRVFGKVLKFFQWLLNSYGVHARLRPGDTCITPFEGVAFIGARARNIVIVHHIDDSFSPFYTSLINAICLWFLSRRQGRISRIIVVSRYWRDELIRLGIPSNKIEIIYNFFEAPSMELGDRRSFFLRHGISTKKIIYIGNHQVKKGVELVGSLLGDLPDVTLVSSGKQSEPVSMPRNSRYLNLGYEDYLRVLSFSEVVIAFSLFEEGWCRSAHEAIMMGREVIGSGAGGMRELLEVSGLQAVDLEQVRSEVIRILERGAKAVDRNKLQELTNREEFKAKWLKLVLLEKVDSVFKPIK